MVIDLLPGAPYNKQVANCCKGGVLSSMLQEPDKALAAFQLQVGGMISKNDTIVSLPENFTLGLDGYTCGPLEQVAATKFFEDHGRRKTQSLGTCIYLELCIIS